MMMGSIFGLAKDAWSWVKSVPSSPDGTGSSSRVIALSVTSCVMGVFVANFVYHHSIPESSQLYGLSALLAAGMGAYATNKIRRDQNGGDPPGPGGN